MPSQPPTTVPDHGGGIANVSPVHIKEALLFEHMAVNFANPFAQSQYRATTDSSRRYPPQPDKQLYIIPRVQQQPTTSYASHPTQSQDSSHLYQQPSNVAPVYSDARSMGPPVMPYQSAQPFYE